jgi:hypothetical protein
MISKNDGDDDDYCQDNNENRFVNENMFVNENNKKTDYIGKINYPLYQNNCKSSNQTSSYKNTKKNDNRIINNKTNEWKYFYNEGKY